MKKEYVIGIFFFSGIWGISETLLGGAIYAANIPYASVPLTVIAFIILTFARIYLPQIGTATLIAALALLYKFLNSPFFACHMLGIFLTGLCYDVFFSVLKLKNKSLCAGGAVYLSYISFALLMTYLFCYEYWAEAGPPKVINFIVVGGSMAALGCAVAVPLSISISQKLRSKENVPLNMRLRLANARISVVTTLIWIFGLAVFLLKV